MKYRFLHILLASLLWFSSTGVVLSMHYCQDNLRDVALFVKAENCHAQKQKENAMPKGCPMHQAPSTTHQTEEDPEKNCCDDTAEYLQLQEDILKTDIEFKSFILPLLFAINWQMAGQSPYSTDRISVDYLFYKPPLLVCDRPVVLQTFLL